MVTLILMFLSTLINVAFVTLGSQSWQVPRNGRVVGVTLCVTGYTDGTASNQTKAGLFPFNPAIANFTDNVSQCLAMIGFNSTAVAAFPVVQATFVPLNYQAVAGKLIYLAGTSTMALGASAYAIIQFDG